MSRAVCAECETPNQNLKECNKCKRRICPYCAEDGHMNDKGVLCSGDDDVED